MSENSNEEQPISVEVDTTTEEVTAASTDINAITTGATTTGVTFVDSNGYVMADMAPTQVQPQPEEFLDPAVQEKKEESKEIDSELAKKIKKDLDETAFKQKITRDQLIILDYNDGPKILTHDRTGEHTVETLMGSSTYTIQSRSYPAIRNFILFDKNMNHVVVNDESASTKTGERLIKGISYPRVNHLNFNNDFAVGVRTKKWVIVDRHEFISSKGKRLKIISQSPHLTKDIKARLKKEIRREFIYAQQVMDMMRSAIHSVYDEDHFEIIYCINPGSFQRFNIFVKFPNLVVKNSIEIEHTVDNLVVRLGGRTMVSNKVDYVSIEGEIAGMRTHYTEHDFLVGYVHSHIPSHTHGFGWFCMGEKHFLSRGTRRVTSLDLEMMMVAMFEHISWESLEGGPHYSMERAKLDGKSKNKRSLVNHNHSLELTTPYRIKNNFIRDVVNLMKTKNLGEIKECFRGSFTNDGVGVSVDYEKFMKAFVNMFSKEELLTLRRRYGTEVQFYEMERDERGNVRVYAVQRKKELGSVKNTLLNMSPIYMNGKYIKPYVERERKKKDGSKEPVPIFNLNFIDHVASAICGSIVYNIKLYNNDEKRKKTKGETSSYGIKRKRNSNNTGLHLQPDQLSSQSSRK
jgi:hypothetical protein